MLLTGIIPGMYACNRLSSIEQKKDKALVKLASGLRIANSADDAAGLAISEKMRGQIRGFQMAARNVQDGISLIQTAEGAMNEDHAILQRIRELTVQAANDTNTSSDREAISGEISRLIEAAEDILINTEFNTKKLFLGMDTDPIILQVGANENQNINLLIEKTKIPSWGYFAAAAGGLIIGVPGDSQIVDLSSSVKASQFLAVTDQAVVDLSDVRSHLGAMQNRLEHTLANLQNSELNLSGAESRIRDADMALVMTDFTRQTILQQASIAVLSQAGQIEGNNLLSLLL